MPEGEVTHGHEDLEKGVDKGPENSRENIREGSPEVGDNSDTTPIVNEDLKRSAEVIARAMDLIEKQEIKMKEMEAKLAAYDMSNLRKLEERVEELTDRLPKTVRDEKANIRGYYDFDGAAGRLANENAEAEYQRAKAELDGIIKGRINN